MMADFFDNLLSRSSLPTGGNILQPRLPSLFEAPSSQGGIPTPMADAPVAENLVPSTVDQALAGAIRQETVPPVNSPVFPIAEQTNPEHSVTHPDLPVKGNLGDRKSAATAATPPLIEKTIAHVRTVAHQNADSFISPKDRPALDPLDVQPAFPVQKRSVNRASISVGERSAESHRKTIKQDAPKTPPSESDFNPRPENNPSFNTPPLHPTVALSEPVFQPLHRVSAITENETVVRVHIGRIDVRAVTPPTSTRATPVTRQQAKMSLEEYLRQREEKR